MKLEDSGHEVIRDPHGRPFTEEELRTLIRGVGGIIVALDAISREVIAAAQKLKVIPKYDVGVGNIDLEAARAKGIIVTYYTPSSNSEAVAHLTMGLLLAAPRKIPSAGGALRSGDWRKVGRE